MAWLQRSVGALAGCERPFQIVASAARRTNSIVNVGSRQQISLLPSLHATFETTASTFLRLFDLAEIINLNQPAQNTRQLARSNIIYARNIRRSLILISWPGSRSGSEFVNGCDKLNQFDSLSLGATSLRPSMRIAQSCGSLPS